MGRCWGGILLGVACLGWLPARADESAILSELERVKTLYSTEIVRVEAMIGDAVEKRLIAARKGGNKKLVDLIEIEQKAFQDYSDIPPATPAVVRKKAATLAATLDRAYVAALRSLTKEGLDDEAAAVQKEYDEFQFRIAMRQTRSTLMGTWKLEMGGYWSDFTFHPDGTMYHSTEKHTGTWRVSVPKRCIMVFGPGGGDPATGSGADMINLPLDPRGTEGKGSNGGGFTLTKKK